MRIGIDTGGTFTDFVVLRDDGSIESFKLRSNPRSPARVILDGLRRIGAPARTEVVHGSTVATNALLERKGARTALVTTRGFTDLVRIGRQNRAQLYNLTPPLKRHLAPPSLCFGVAERAYFDGSIGQRPTRRELAELKTRLRRAGVESVAICFLHSYENSENEQAAARALARRILPVLFARSLARVSRVRARFHNSDQRVRRPAHGRVSFRAGPRHPAPHLHSAIERRLYYSSRGAPPCRAHHSFRAGRRRGGRGRGRPLERLRARSHVRHGRDIHRRQPLGRPASADHGRFRGRDSRARADARHSHGGRRRRVDRARG